MDVSRNGILRHGLESCNLGDRKIANFGKYGNDPCVTKEHFIQTSKDRLWKLLYYRQFSLKILNNARVLPHKLQKAPI